MKLAILVCLRCCATSSRAVAYSASRACHASQFEGEVQCKECCMVTTLRRKSQPGLGHDSALVTISVVDSYPLHYDGLLPLSQTQQVQPGQADSLVLTRIRLTSVSMTSSHGQMAKTNLS
jgi:hypothetical protein